MIKAPLLTAIPGVAHAFFTREGGVSQGLYRSLNCGLGSKDERDRVLQNRAFVAGTLGVAADRLVSLYQVHSPHCVVVEKPFSPDQAQQADAMVTKVPGLALAVSAADCTPILFAGEGVIGAAHAGWRGALKGVIEATIAGLVALGARIETIRAVIGPTISQSNYEVGLEVLDAFFAKDEQYRPFFVASQHPEKFLFDLPGLVAHRLRQAGITAIEDLGLCTYADEKRFFSYRRMTHRGEADFGRHLHAIMLKPDSLGAGSALKVTI